jgi:hypothetical protein
MVSLPNVSKKREHGAKTEKHIGQDEPHTMPDFYSHRLGTGSYTGSRLNFVEGLSPPRPPSSPFRIQRSTKA